MAEDPKIVLDDPPRAPIDVQVTVDVPPWEPIDVQTYPDGGPWDPIDVPLYPDPPPWTESQVPTYPDGPPWTPRDVPVALDPPPWAPQDVNIVPDPAPWQPVDVQTVADPPPRPPVDVQTTPDAAPWAPVDVPVVLSPPPWSPVDVQVTPDAPGPLSGEPDRMHYKVPPPYEPKVTVTTAELSDRLRKYDHQLSTFLDSIGEFVPFVSAAGRGALDPLALANWLRNYKDAVGLGGIAKFLEEQAVLYAMNPTVARFFDPTYFLKMAIPGSTGMVNTHISTGFDSSTDVALIKDQLLPSQPWFVEQERVRRSDNTFDEENMYTHGQDFSVDEMVEARTQDPPGRSQYLLEDPETGVARFNASSYFDPPAAGRERIRGTTKGRIIAGQGPNVRTSKLARSAATHGIIRIPVPGDGDPRPGKTISYDGVVLSENTVPPVDDDDVRLPLCFTDLRKDPASEAYRHVYFQPMNLVINTSFSPQYNESQSFGRVDPSVGYVGTSRTWSVSFEQHAFAPEDLRIMYEKMTWLTSMVYPTYGDDALMRSGPVCRMRVGDVASTSEGGVPGVIRNLSFDFAECIWELKRGMKVPRSFGVQLEYLVLHDGPVGILNGMFGVLALPSGPTTNMAGRGPATPSQETTDQGSADTVSIARGRWASFGEPTKKG